MLTAGALAVVLGLFGVPHAVEAAIEYVGGAEGSGASAAYAVSLTSLTGGIGSAPAAGDLVIVATGFVSTANGNPGVSTTGYTEVADLYANDTRDANFSVNWKIMGASPDTSVTCLGSGGNNLGAVCVVHVWRGVDQSTPMDVTDTEATGTNSAVPNSPSITPVTSGAVVIATGLGTGAAVDNSVTAPSGFGNQVDISAIGSGGATNLAATAGISSMAWSGSGAVDPAAWTNWTTSTSDSWAAVSLALRPAPFVAGVTITSSVVFNLDLDIIGGLSKGSGTFVIDHPLKPKTHLLYHSFLESPDVKNMYDGVAELNSSGEVTIQLPDYFEALNKDFRYQFFPLDEAMPNLHIKEEVKDNQFTIGGGKSGGRVSWQITGIRHDPYIKANPIEVEVEKTADTKIPAGQCVFEPLCR